MSYLRRSLFNQCLIFDFPVENYVEEGGDIKGHPPAMMKVNHSPEPLNLRNPGTSQKVVEPPSVKRIRSESAESYQSDTSSDPNRELTPTNRLDENAGVFFN